MGGLPKFLKRAFSASFFEFKAGRVLRIEGINEVKKIDDSVYDIHRWDDKTHFYKKISVTDPSLSKPFENTERVAKFSLREFTGMLAFQGLQVQEIFGDYHFNKYDVRKTPRLILVARKSKV